mgnify:CR=1 FL=1
MGNQLVISEKTKGIKAEFGANSKYIIIKNVDLTEISDSEYAGAAKKLKKIFPLMEHIAFDNCKVC